MAKHVTAVAGTAGGVVLGSTVLGMKPEQLMQMGEWLNKILTPAGFVSFIFNIALGFAVYFIFKYFADKDREKREDIKEAFAQNVRNARDTRETLTNVEAALTRFRVILAQKGYNEDAPEPVQQESRPTFKLHGAPEKS